MCSRRNVFRHTTSLIQFLRSLKLFVAALLLVFLLWVSHSILERWWRPKKLEAMLRSQGLQGPPTHFLTGNAVHEHQQERKETGEDLRLGHDILPHLLPSVPTWAKLFGKPFVYQFFGETRVMLFDPESVREVMSTQFSSFQKSDMQLGFIVSFIGQGLLGVNGDQWSHHRAVLSPAFYTQKLKSMIPCFQTCTTELVKEWEQRLADGEEEIEVTEGLRRLSANAISLTAFGSNYEKGQRVFQGLSQLFELLIKLYAYYARTSLFRYVPTPINVKLWKVRKEVDCILRSMIRERQDAFRSGSSKTFGNDLLGLILEESEKLDNKSGLFNMKSVIDECKTFYLAGHETTAGLLGWTLFLLSINPHWQDRARAEIQEHCGAELKQGDLGKLKLVGMILFETLRLYPAVSELHRATTKDIVVNGVKLPEGTGVTIPVLWLHHDEELWGADVKEFNPERFAEGAAKACKHPNAYLPFSVGPRVCMGQMFALLEAKVALVLLLRNFSFGLSPKYKHNPCQRTVISPKHGIQLLLRRR